MDKNCVLVTVVLFLHGVLCAQMYTTTETSFVNDSVTIYGDILVPANPITPATGIAIIQGSGNSDRSNAWSAAFAKFLAGNGYYVLLPDKRGAGKSGGDWKTASFEVLAKDAELYALHLKNKMQLSKTGVMGLSQGGFIAPVAASKNKAIDFVINLSGAAVTLEEQIIHEVTNTAINNGLTPDQVAGILQLHVLMKDYALNGKWEPLQSKFTELGKTPMAVL